MDIIITHLFLRLIVKIYSTYYLRNNKTLSIILLSMFLIEIMSLNFHLGESQCTLKCMLQIFRVRKLRKIFNSFCSTYIYMLSK